MGEWPMADRALELRRIRTLMLDGTARGVVLAAPAGIGKTRLAREACKVAEQAGFTTLWVTATRAASALPLGAFAPYLPLDVGGAGPGEQLGDRAVLLQRIAAGLMEPVRGRLALFVDDAHLLDEASAALLLHVIVAHDPFVVATIRAGERVPDAVLTLWKDDLLQRIDLGALGDREVEELLSTVLGGPIDPAVVALITARARGNVLFLRELVLGALENDCLRDDHGMWRLVRPLAPSDRLAGLIEARLADLTPAERELVDVLACAESIGTAEVRAFDAAAAVERLEIAGIVAVALDGRRLDVRFAHPLYGDVVRRHLPATAERRIVQRLAEVVEQAGARRREDVLRVASWRLVAGGADAGLMLRAAETARWRFDFDLAERLADAAVRLGAGFHARLLLAQLQHLQGRGREAERQLDELAATASTDDERVLVARTQLDNALRGRDTPRYLELAANIESTIEDPAVRDLIAARRVGLLIVHNGFGAGDELLHRLVSTTTGEALVFSCYAAAYAWARQGRTSDAIAAADRGYTAHLELGQQLEWYPWTHRHFRCLALSYAGELDESEKEAREHHERMVELGDRDGQAIFAVTLAQHVGARGNVRSAAKCAREAVTVFRELDRPPFVHFSLLRLGLALALEGRREELATVLQDLDAFGTPPAVFRADHAETRAWAAVANGDIPLARALLLAGVDEGLQIDDLVGASSLLHALARLGDARSAAPRLAEVAASMDGGLAPTRVLHADGLVRGNPEMLEAASSDFERMGAYLLAAEAAADAAVAWQRAGATRARSSAQRRSSELAARCEGASTPALQAIDFRAQLTPAERETAMLACTGRTDRQIADELHLSVRTVENRLHRVYVKLGISRRDELPDALGE